MFHLLTIRQSIDTFSTETCKVTFGLKYIYGYPSYCLDFIVTTLNEGNLKK